jgi:hypothetical protein
VNEKKLFLGLNKRMVRSSSLLQISHPKGFDQDSTELYAAVGAFVHARATVDALVLVDHGYVVDGYCILRADILTRPTCDAFIGADQRWHISCLR